MEQYYTQYQGRTMGKKQSLSDNTVANSRVIEKAGTLKDQGIERFTAFATNNDYSYKFRLFVLARLTGDERVKNHERAAYSLARMYKVDELVSDSEMSKNTTLTLMVEHMIDASPRSYKNGGGWYGYQMLLAGSARDIMNEGLTNECYMSSPRHFIEESTHTRPRNRDYYEFVQNGLKTVYNFTPTVLAPVITAFDIIRCRDGARINPQFLYPTLKRLKKKVNLAGNTVDNLIDYCSNQLSTGQKAAVDL